MRPEGARPEQEVQSTRCAGCCSLPEGSSLREDPSLLRLPSLASCRRGQRLMPWRRHARFSVVGQMRRFDAASPQPHPKLRLQDARTTIPLQMHADWFLVNSFWVNGCLGTTAHCS